MTHISKSDELFMSPFWSETLCRSPRHKYDILFLDFSGDINQVVTW